jgi:hypothetical protein
VACSRHGGGTSVYCCQICDVGLSVQDSLNCITLRSTTEVMKIILLQLYSFKIPLIKFQKNRIISLQVIFFFN